MTPGSSNLIEVIERQEIKIDKLLKMCSDTYIRKVLSSVAVRRELDDPEANLLKLSHL